MQSSKPKSLKSKINSRQKGAQGEREWAKFLTAHGFPSTRGFPLKDNLCESLSYIHFEVKRVENLNIYDALAQAARDGGPKKVPVVAHRKNGKEWLITLPASAFLEGLSDG